MAVLVAAGCLTLVAPAIARADVIGQWNAIAQAETLPLRPTAHGETRGIAMVEGAVYDAVNAIDRGYQPYLVDLDVVGAQPFDSQDAAVATAAYRVLLGITPVGRQLSLGLQYDATLAGIPDGPPSRAASRPARPPPRRCSPPAQGDGFMAAFTFDIGTDAGDWRPVGWPPVLGARPRSVGRQPEAVPDREPVAVPLRGAERADERRVRRGLRRGEVARGARQHDADGRRDGGRRLLAVRADPALEPARRATSPAARARHGRRGPALAMVNLAAADGAIACWNDKYDWKFWRPRAAIREARHRRQPGDDRRSELGVAVRACDGDDPAARHAAVPRPPVWTRLPERCGPEHDGRLLRHRQGRDHVRLRSLPRRQPRHFDRFSRVTKEIIDARVWGGIHFRTADVQGTVIGKKVAHWVRKHYFQPTR